MTSVWRAYLKWCSDDGSIGLGCNRRVLLFLLFRAPQYLRWIQAAAAQLWIVYGALLHATPVVAANVIVALAAMGSSLRTTSAIRPANG